MTESRRIRSFRCADTLWRALEDEADERGITIDALITEAMWSYLRAAPDFASESTQSARLEALMLAAARDAHRRSDPIPSGGRIGVGQASATTRESGAGTQPLQSERTRPTDSGARPSSSPSSDAQYADTPQYDENDPHDAFVGSTTAVQPRLRPNPTVQALNPSKGLVRRARAEDGEPTLDDFQLRLDERGQVLDQQTGELLGGAPEAVCDDAQRAAAAARPKIALLFSDTRYPVNGDRFLIGRASTGTDLQIRDANVSRKHAAVIFHDGGWFIHDLQSTNGVEFRGRRIHTRRIEHNDRYSICDYELTFELED